MAREVEGAFEAEGYPRPALDAERRKGEDLAFMLENARQSVEMHVFADGARQIDARALATQRERNCPTCTAPLDVPVAYRALNLRCAHCGAVSTFEPGSSPVRRSPSVPTRSRGSPRKANGTRCAKPNAACATKGRLSPWRC